MTTQQPTTCLQAIIMQLATDMNRPTTRAIHGALATLMPPEIIGLVTEYVVGDEQHQVQVAKHYVCMSQLAQVISPVQDNEWGWIYEVVLGELMPCINNDAHYNIRRNKACVIKAIKAINTQA